MHGPPLQEWRQLPGNGIFEEVGVFCDGGFEAVDVAAREDHRGGGETDGAVLGSRLGQLSQKT